MQIIGNGVTDIGIKKSVNQDSLAFRTMNTFLGEVVFAIVCDGMGGLQEGEVASATVTTAFLDWFDDELPLLLESGINDRYIKTIWEQKLTTLNQVLVQYGNQSNMKIGTTMNLFLGIGKVAYVMNIGDTRLYEIGKELNQMTIDHTFVNRELEAGRLTQEEVQNHPKKHVLTSCVGVNDKLDCDFYKLDFLEDHLYLICSDGFRNNLTAEMLLETVNDGSHISNSNLGHKLTSLTEWVKNSGEKDNISSILFGRFNEWMVMSSEGNDLITEELDDGISIVFVHGNSL